MRLRGFPCKTETFVRKSDATRWASATETHLREARHFPGDGPPERTLSELVARYQREVVPRIPKNAKYLRPELHWRRSQLGDLNLARSRRQKCGVYAAPDAPNYRVKSIRRGVED